MEDPAVPVMAGESLSQAKAGGPLSTSLLGAASKDVDTDLRRHDDLVPGSLSGSVGINSRARQIDTERLVGARQPSVVRQ
jgi:hypothetical protein